MRHRKEVRLWIPILGSVVLAGLVRAIWTNKSNKREVVMPQEPSIAVWRLPPDVAGDATVPYDDAPRWEEGKHCAGGPSRGIKRLSLALQKQFPAIRKIEGYACRRNTANLEKLSMHGTGRAADIYCDRQTGDAVATWLVANAARIGVQFVIWRRSCWNGSKAAPKLRPYLGPKPHEDHVHCEITLAAAEAKTPFFAETSAG